MSKSINHFSAQSDKILAVLTVAAGSWVPLPEILSLGIAQYSARIHELRKRGLRIENRVERQEDGSRHSWFRLVSGNTTPPPQHTPAPKEPAWEDRPRVTGLELFDAAVRR